MRPQYHIVKECLHLIHQDGIPADSKKLRAEILLIRLQMLLLQDDLPVDISRGPCSEDALKEILHDMKGIYSNKDGPDPTGTYPLVERLYTIYSLLKTEQPLNFSGWIEMQRRNDVFPL